ncbi:MAG: hypothetical protein JW798_10465 [Prolixibacteraceae bacterium]|nr:hypothetical protein [Prolixibacteraceae bacterium]
MKVVDIISFLNLVSAIIAISLAFIIFRSRRKGYHITLAALFLSGAWWNLSMFFESFSTHVSGHIFWNVVAYPGILCAPVLLFLFLYEYTHFNKSIPRWLVFLLFVIPLVSSIIVALPGWRQLVWKEITLNQTPFGDIAHFEHGWWYYIEAYYSYALIVIAIFFLIRGLSLFSKKYSTQVVIILGSSIIPLIINVIYSLNSDYFYGLDLTPIAFMITSFLFYIAISTHKLLRITPIAWNVVFENIQEGVIVLVEDTIVGMNSSAMKIFNSIGYKNLEGASASESFKNWHTFNDFLSNSKTNEMDYLPVGDCFFKITKDDIKNSHQTKTGEVLIFHDITDIVKKEREIKKINKQLHEANETKDLLFKIISHDLKGSVGNINSLLEYFWTENTTPNKKEMDALYSTSSNLSYLTENLLFWANSQQNKILLFPANHFIWNTVSVVIESLRYQALSKGITIINNCQKNIEAYYDEPSIEIVIRNLISNSIKFSHTNGEIKIYLTQSPGKVSIHVADKGVGLSEETCEKIQNNIAVKSMPGTGNEKGTGIGFPLCRRLVKANNGDLLIESKLNLGTTVSIILPAV